MSSWRTRRKGTPNQVGTRFPIREGEPYRARDVEVQKIYREQPTVCLACGGTGLDENGNLCQQCGGRGVVERPWWQKRIEENAEKVRRGDYGEFIEETMEDSGWMDGVQLPNFRMADGRILQVNESGVYEKSPAGGWSLTKPVARELLTKMSRKRSLENKDVSINEEVDITVFQNKKAIAGGIDSQWTRRYDTKELKEKIKDLYDYFSHNDLVTGITIEATSRRDGSHVMSSKEPEKDYDSRALDEDRRHMRSLETKAELSYDPRERLLEEGEEPEESEDEEREEL